MNETKNRNWDNFWWDDETETYTQNKNKQMKLVKETINVKEKEIKNPLRGWDCKMMKVTNWKKNERNGNIKKT